MPQHNCNCCHSHVRHIHSCLVATSEWILYRWKERHGCQESFILLLCEKYFIYPCEIYLRVALKRSQNYHCESFLTSRLKNFIESSFSLLQVWIHMSHHSWLLFLFINFIKIFSWASWTKRETIKWFLMRMNMKLWQRRMAQDGGFLCWRYH